MDTSTATAATGATPLGVPEGVLPLTGATAGTTAVTPPVTVATVGSGQGNTTAQTEQLATSKTVAPVVSSTPVTEAPAPSVPPTGAASTWNVTNARIGIGAIGVNLIDAAIHKEVTKAAEVTGTAVGLHCGMKAVAATVGVKAVPVVGQVVGAGFAAQDAYHAAQSGNTTRAAISGVEATLYSVATVSATAAAFNVWNPAGWAAGTVAVVTGGAALAITTSKMIYDSQKKIREWGQPDLAKASDTAVATAKPAVVMPSSPQALPVSMAQAPIPQSQLDRYAAAKARQNARVHPSLMWKNQSPVGVTKDQPVQVEPAASLQKYSATRPQQASNLKSAASTAVHSKPSAPVVTKVAATQHPHLMHATP